MGKIKTKKALLKRIRVTSKGKIMRRSVRQGHFNAKESSNKTRGKRRINKISQVDKKRIKKILPSI